MMKPTVPTGGDNARAAQATLRERVEATLRSVYDPEIPVNIFELGLIYALEVTDDGVVDIKMTLTAPNCPAAGAMPGEVEAKVRAVEAVRISPGRGARQATAPASKLRFLGSAGSR